MENPANGIPESTPDDELDPDVELTDSDTGRLAHDRKLAAAEKRQRKMRLEVLRAFGFESQREFNEARAAGRLPKLELTAGLAAQSEGQQDRPSNVSEGEEPDGPSPADRQAVDVALSLELAEIAPRDPRGIFAFVRSHARLDQAGAVVIDTPDGPRNLLQVIPLDFQRATGFAGSGSKAPAQLSTPSSDGRSVGEETRRSQRFFEKHSVAIGELQRQGRNLDDVSLGELTRLEAKR